MEELLSRFSVSEIILFTVLLGLAIKGVIDFFDWAHSRLKEKFDKENTNTENQNVTNKRIEDAENEIKELQNNQEEILKTLEKLNNKIDILVESDKDDIKSYLTRIHHFYCYTQKWIDDYTLECCERRYSHYTDEGGNSFIGGFMQDLRALPKRPPENHSNIMDAIIS